MNHTIDWRDGNSDECFEFLKIAERTIWYLAGQCNDELRQLITATQCYRKTNTKKDDTADRVTVFVDVDERIEPALGIKLQITEGKCHARKSFGTLENEQTNMVFLTQTMVRKVFRQLDKNLREAVADAVMPPAFDYFSFRIEERGMYDVLPVLRNRLERLDRRIRAGDFRVK